MIQLTFNNAREKNPELFIKDFNQSKLRVDVVWCVQFDDEFKWMLKIKKTVNNYLIEFITWHELNLFIHYWYYGHVRFFFLKIKTPKEY